MLLAAATAEVLPAWLAWPLGLLFVFSLTGLCYSVGALIRLNNPAGNAFELPASQTNFRCTFTQAGKYEVACTRPRQWGQYFSLPRVSLGLRRLVTGAEQPLPVGTRGLVRRTNMEGATTLTLAAFILADPGEYELLNPQAHQFKPGDRLRLMPATGAKNVLLILAVVFTGVGTIASFVLALVAALGSR